MGHNRAIQLPRDRSCAARARRFVEQQLAAHVSGATLDDARLVASELVDNAYLHGRGEMTLSVAHTASRVRLEVVDEGSGAAIKIRHRAADDFGGHGLRLVRELASGWGAYEGTTHVWAELRPR